MELITCTPNNISEFCMSSVTQSKRVSMSGIEQGGCNIEDLRVLVPIFVMQ